MSSRRLHTLIVAGEPEDAELAQRVLQDNGDYASRCGDVPEALSRMGQESFDLAFVSLSMPRGDGLALVHHLRALYPEVEVVAMAGRDEVEEVGSALALGVLSSLLTPLTGDDILVAADRVRERRLLLERASKPSVIPSMAPVDIEPAVADRAEIYRRSHAFIGEVSTGRILSGLLEACEPELSSKAAAAYLVSSRDDAKLRRQPTGHDPGDLPSEVPAEIVQRLGQSEPVCFTDGQLYLAVSSGSGLSGAVAFQLEGNELPDDAQVAALRAIVQLAAAALLAASRHRAVAKGGIRDADTGAYTFAYFGDVAARELDRAVRHQRAFALLTLSLGLDTDGTGADLDVQRLLAKAVLTAVRSGDVVARRDDDTFYLLLPETGLLGALACRRRVHETVERVLQGDSREAELARDHLGDRELEPSSGISVFPGDGQDLGELLKLSRRRVERARGGVWKKLGLDRMGFWEALDLLTSDEAEIDDELVRGSGGLAGRARMPLALVSRIADGLIRDAAREGLSGALYLAGDTEFSSVVARAVDSADRLSLRTWMLGPARTVRDPAARIRLPLTDSRLGRAHLLLCINERGGYCMLGRATEPGELLAFHTSDLEIVEGLVSALQREYHLQPELK